MLQSLRIENYAIIQSVQIQFSKGFTIITGETGAGKSILLGALSLIQGKRADLQVLLNKEKKCIVEALFDISDYNLHSFFDTHELDFETETIIRREILPSGKSRAFINDTPVNLDILTRLTDRLIDIHSQHQNLTVGQQAFQLKVVDTLAKNQGILNEYQELFKSYSVLQRKLKDFKDAAENNAKEYDYLNFQYQELAQAALVQDEEEALEQEQDELSHAEEIANALGIANNYLQNNEEDLLTSIKNVFSSLQKAAQYYKPVRELLPRVESVMVEMKDIATDIALWSEKFEFNPDRLEEINQRLALIYSLKQKHHVEGIGELIQLQNDLAQKIEDIESYDERIVEQEKALEQALVQLQQVAVKLTESRKKAADQLTVTINIGLADLAMPEGEFKVSIDKSDSFSIDGIDQVSFLFTANKNIPLADVSKVASGGELSRLMLSIKSQLSHAADLPTIIFDEIDTGISGEIASKVGQIIKQMSTNMQVINITHLPQVASKADQHILVYKNQDGDTATTHLKELDKNERVEVLAKMLSGEQVTNAAMDNARQLLNL